MSIFKRIYSHSFFDQLGTVIKEVVPSFNKQVFIAQIFDDSWSELELKQMMRHISKVLRDHLDADYAYSLGQILEVIQILKTKGIKEKYVEFMFFPDYVEIHGLDHYEPSVKALEQITQFTSCEFAVRPFIIKYPKKMLAQMMAWSQHEQPMVRRLATEGCRPRLPWAMALPDLKKDPTPILPILEQLKSDESESVRRSVANNLNDIAKDNPSMVIHLVKLWKGQSKDVDWVLKHGCRTLLKQGNPKVMSLFGLGSSEGLEVQKLKVLTPQVQIGSALEFSFQLVNRRNEDVLVRLEYGLYYLKANGSLSKKVFKISEKSYPRQSESIINRKQSFKLITTRKFYLGEHWLSIIINGQEFEKASFKLI